ncbi:hypothetical protein Tco_0591518 [Tanacetum coccineum]
MESSSLNSEEMELQHMQLDERKLHQKLLGIDSKAQETSWISLYWQKNFIDGTKWEPKNYRHLLLRYLEELDKLIDERVLKYGALRMIEKEVQAIKEIERRLQESEMQKHNSLVFKGTTLEDCMVTDAVELEACLITEGAAIEACLVTKGATLEACLVNEGIVVNDNTSVMKSSRTESENNSSTTPFNRSEDENRSSDKDCNSSRNECNKSGNENICSNHESTSLGNDANADIGPSYDYDIVTKRAFFAALINNLKCDVEKCNEVNREAQQENGLLTNEIERYKEKEKHFAKDMIIESEYRKKIKLLNDEISYFKSQAYEKDKTFAKKNEKYDEYVQPLFRKENDLKRKFRVLKLDNRRRKGGQTDHTLRLLHPKEDNVRAQRAMLKFEKQTFSKLELNRDDLLRVSFEQSINVRVRNRLSDEFEPLVKNVNLQLNFFEKSLDKEMKDDLNYVISLKDEFDEECLILDNQQEFFKT